MKYQNKNCSAEVLDEVPSSPPVRIAIEAPLSEWKRLVTTLGPTHEGQLAYSFYAVVKQAVESQS